MRLPIPPRVVAATRQWRLLIFPMASFIFSMAVIGCQPVRLETPAVKQALTVAVSTASQRQPDISPLTDLEAAQILFAKRSLPLGEVETTFRQQLADGYFQDYTRQDLDVNGDGRNAAFACL